MGGASLASLVTLAAMAIAAVGVLWWALRGWKQQLPPSCRACLYDVSGRSADSTRCSECGADLSGAGAIVTVVRRRRWIWAGVACVIMVAAGDVGIEGAARLPWRAWFVRAAPAWVIHRQARKDLWPGGDAYRGEWYRREGASPALIDHLLDTQANPAAPYSAAWDNVLGAAFTPGGAMSPAQRQRYTAQALETSVRLTPDKTREASGALYVTVEWAARGLFGSGRFVRYDLCTSVDGAAPTKSSGGAESFVTGNAMAIVRADPDASGTWLSPGMHHLRVTVRRQAMDRATGPLTPPIHVVGELSLAGPNTAQPAKR